MSSTEPGIDPISPVLPEAVTSRQREVARLVAEGHTNTEIAAELGITLDGAKYHVSELLTRLGLRRREEVGEWYRAHFGPVARLRRFMRGIIGLPILGIAGGAASVTGVVVVSVFAFVALRGAASESEIGPPEYVPFIQEWEIYSIEEPNREATLGWNGCGEWEYREADASGQIHVGYGQGPPTDADPGCHIPSHWFRPIDSFRNNPNPDVQQLAPFEYENVSTRDCSEVSNIVMPDNPIGPGFCSEPSDTFEDRVVVGFDPDTLIPMRYSQYIDGVLSSEFRAVSLRILGSSEARPLPSAGGDGSNSLASLTTPTPP